MKATTTHPFAALLPNPPALPTIRDEDWRFTPLKAVTSQAWAAPSASPVKLEAPDLGGARLVFVNGRAEVSLSRLGLLPAGVTIASEVSPLRICGTDQPFVALNEQLARAGAVIRVARNVKVERPLQILYAGSDGAAFTRVAIELEQGAELTLEEHFSSQGQHFLGSVTEATLAPNASLKLARVIAGSAQAVHISSFAARLARDARIVLDSIALEAALARNDLHVILDGEGANAELRGLGLAHGVSLLDHQVLIDHARPHCTSNQVFRNIVDDKARAVFSGRVVVRPGAMGTDARQQNNNMLLSDDARVDTKPMLEIYADDVKCSHGATSGQLDPAAVFFLRSRGLDMQQTRAVLTWAFANEIVQHVAAPGVGESVMAAIRERFKGMEQ